MVVPNEDADGSDAILRTINRAAVQATLDGREQVTVAFWGGPTRASEPIFVPDCVRLDIRGCMFGGDAQLRFVGQPRPPRLLRILDWLLQWRLRA